MEDKIKQILTNHKLSSLEGLHQITGGDIDEVKKAVDKLIEDGWLTSGVHDWNGTSWIVYSKKKERKKKEEV